MKNNEPPTSEGSVKEKFLVVGNRVIRLATKEGGPEDFFYDEYGTLWALRSDIGSWDNVSRCGVFPFVFPQGTPIDDVCDVHDFMYSSPVFQHFHTRSEADDYLRTGGKAVGMPITGRVFKLLSIKFGWMVWENKKTKWK